MGHLSKWVIQVNGSAERGFQVNGSFKQIGHSTEWVAEKGLSSEWVIQANGLFE